MKQLFIKEHSNNNQRMTVRDNRGQILYVIKGRWGRKNDITAIYELNGNLIMSVKQVKNTPLPVFTIREAGEEIAQMRKHPGLFGIRDSYFTIHPFNWVVTGDFEDLYFMVHENQQLIMECEKDIYNQHAVYELMIEDEAYAPACALISTLFDPHSRNKDEDEQFEDVESSDYDFGFNPFILPSSDYSPIKEKPRLHTKTR